MEAEVGTCKKDLVMGRDRTSGYVEMRNWIIFCKASHLDLTNSPSRSTFECDCEEGEWRWRREEEGKQEHTEGVLIVGSIFGDGSWRRASSSIG
jgi:hypothetical protein